MAIKLKTENTAVRRLDIYLSAAWRTEMQARHYLIKAGYSSDEVNAAIQKALEKGVLNDKFYAEEYVRLHSSKFGNVKLKYNLMKRGISPEIIEEALAGNEYGEDEMTAACRLAEKIVGNKEVDEKLRRRLASRLRSAGFSSSVAMEVMNKYAKW